MKKINSVEVLEIIKDLTLETLPKNKNGKLHLRYDDNGGIEIFFIEKEMVEA